jgi:multidrug efflux pump subunit AcrA (membrane-fusion protein)
MNEENKDLDETVDEVISDQNIDDSGASFGTRKLLIVFVGCILLLGIVAAAVWFAFYRTEGGQPVAAPRGVSFDKDDNKSVIPEGEQIVSLTDDQLEAAALKFETIGESLGSVASNSATTGVVRSNEYKETPVLSQVGGVVKRINAELGTYVRKGDTIAVVSSDELAKVQSDFLPRKAELDEAQKRYERSISLSEVSEESRNELDRSVAKLKKAEAVLSETKANLIRSEKLEKIGAISTRDLEKSAAAAQTAAADKEEATKRLERARKLLKINPARRNEIDSYLTMVRKKESEVGSIREKLFVLGLSPNRIRGLVSPSNIDADLAIISPVSGSVTERFANRGEVISMNSKLVSVTDLSTVWVIAQVYEKDLGKVTLGSGAGITSDAFEGQYFRGNVSYIDPQLDEATRTAKVRIELRNPGEKFKIGMYVKVALAAVGGTEKTTPMVPEEAVQFIGNDQVVFEPTDDPRNFVIRKVELLEKKANSFPAKKGIFVGDKVVTDGSFLLRAEWLKTNSEK